MSQPSRMLVARDIKQKLRRIFFWTPCTIQAGAELGQAQLKLELDFTSIYLH